MEKLKKLFNVLQEMESTKSQNLGNTTKMSDNNEVKMDLMVMNLLTDKIIKITELEDLMGQYGNNIVISKMPICKYEDKTFIMKDEFSKEEIINLIKNNKKIIMYSDLENNNLENGSYKYRCAVIS